MVPPYQTEISLMQQIPVNYNNEFPELVGGITYIHYGIIANFFAFQSESVFIIGNPSLKICPLQENEPVLLKLFTAAATAVAFW